MHLFFTEVDALPHEEVGIICTSSSAAESFPCHQFKVKYLHSAPKIIVGMQFFRLRLQGANTFHEIKSVKPPYPISKECIPGRESIGWDMGIAVGL